MAGQTLGGVAGPGMLLLVVGLVAGNAVIRIGRTEERAAAIGGVTVPAIQIPVIRRENEITRDGAVIDGGAIPGVRCVARETGGGIPTSGMFLLVVPLVTRDTVVLVGRVEENPRSVRCVTACARQLLVRASQNEPP